MRIDNKIIRKFLKMGHLWMLFAVFLNIFPISVLASEIACGNDVCDLNSRCILYNKVYQCWPGGKELPRPCTIPYGSVDVNGNSLSGDAEKAAIERIKREKNEAQVAAEQDKSKELSRTLSDIIDKVQATEEADEEGTMSIDDAKDLRKYLAQIVATSKDTTIDNSTAASQLNSNYWYAIYKLKDLYKDGYINEDDFITAKTEIERLYKNACKERIENLKQLGQDDAAQTAQEQMSYYLEVSGASKCPTSAQVIARYNSGCWSCLVLEKLTSAFLNAAKSGLKVTKDAGKTLLLYGSIIWIALWGLKNVSSFTQIELGNILNELIRFLFKVAIAYWFIAYVPHAIRDYFITPMMSVGAEIGQQFWHEKMSDYTEEWEGITEEDQEEMQNFVAQKSEAVATPIPQDQEETTITNPLTEEEIQADATAASQNDANFKKGQIPNLLIPGFLGGCVASGAGCRPKSAGGSLCHHGVDVGCIGDASKDCKPYVAAGPGVITYQDMGGYGHMVKVDHGSIGGHTWKTTYNHMNGEFTENLKRQKNLKNGMTVSQGVPIGCVGRSGGTRDSGGRLTINENAFNQHVHFEVYVDDKAVDPLALLEGEIVFIKDLCGPFTSQTKPRKTTNCNGENRATSAAAEKFLGCKPKVKEWGCRNSIPAAGWPAGGEAIIVMNSAVVASADESLVANSNINYDSLVVKIDEVKYSGPTDIMPKSVMNSILGATRAITTTTAEVMVIGNMIMCYSSLENGGAWKLNASSKISWTNWLMWIEGGIIWCLGFMLTVAIAYYLVDISFKIGFAVLALPLVIGLWPFNLTQGKLFVVLSIIAKSSATFAFLALTTRFGLTLVGEALGGLDEFYQEMDTVSQTEGAVESIRTKLNDRLYLFSPQFVLICFSIIYFYKLVQQTISDIVNKFFPDNAFGDSSPMHSGATMMTDYTKKMAGKLTGASMARDIVANQTGNLVKGGLKKAGNVARHPVKSAKSLGNAAKKAGSAIKSALTKKK